MAATTAPLLSMWERMMRRLRRESRGREGEGAAGGGPGAGGGQIGFVAGARAAGPEAPVGCGAGEQELGGLLHRELVQDADVPVALPRRDPVKAFALSPRLAAEGGSGRRGYRPPAR